MNDRQLFLLIGQSNMAGRGTVEPRDRVTNPRIVMLTRELQWTPANDPVHFDKPEIAGVGLCSEFARVLIKTDPRITVGLIPCAFGGTRLDEWKPGDKLYTNAVFRTRKAMESGALAGILWHQGESDAGSAKAATYPERLAAMISLLRRDLGAKTVPLVLGELCRANPVYASFNAAFSDVVRRVPHSALVTSEDLRDKGDKTHFDAESLRVFGRRYAAVFLRLKAAANTARSGAGSL
ncbi:MAG: sialate O-acetylesterase [Cytophagales bacterium]|nr:sialate O-acetylesterase [Armatimonadota bacterium]